MLSIHNHYVYKVWRRARTWLSSHTQSLSTKPFQALSSNTSVCHSSGITGFHDQRDLLSVVVVQSLLPWFRSNTWSNILGTFSLGRIPQMESWIITNSYNFLMSVGHSYQVCNRNHYHLLLHMSQETLFVEHSLLRSLSVSTEICLRGSNTKSSSEWNMQCSSKCAQDVP